MNVLVYACECVFVISDISIKKNSYGFAEQTLVNLAMKIKNKYLWTQILNLIEIISLF